MIKHTLVVGLLLTTLPAQALRCDNRIVQEQDSMLQVLARCGEPALRDRHPPSLHYGYGNFGYPEETWYYNFGPRRLLHILSFRNQRLTRIKTDGYGFRPITNPQCRPNSIVRGMSKLQLLGHCGEPEHRSAHYVLRPQLHHGEVIGHSGVLRESWLYNFGSRHLLREVRLEDGSVTEVRTDGDYGY